jgi:hypothetical protein
MQYFYENHNLKVKPVHIALNREHKENKYMFTLRWKSIHDSFVQFMQGNINVDLMHLGGCAMFDRMFGGIKMWEVSLIN